MSKRSSVIERIGEIRVGAIMRSHDRQLAADAMKAAIDGGFRMVEFTLNTPGAYELISEFSKNDDLLVGAGTTMTVEQTDQAVEAGAAFIVSPVCDEAVIARARELDVVSIPGIYTPNEMVQGHRLGADLLKLFPAPADIPSYIRQVVGPLPHLKIFPTAGVATDNFIDILRAGAFGVAFVSSLFTPEYMKTKDFKAITRRARSIIEKLEAFEQEQK